MSSRLNELNTQIKVLKSARDILKEKYTQTEFHKQREKSPHSTASPTPEDEDIYKLLTAIQQLESHIKELQDEQFELLKEQE